MMEKIEMKTMYHYPGTPNRRTLASKTLPITKNVLRRDSMTLDGNPKVDETTSEDPDPSRRLDVDRDEKWPGGPTNVDNHNQFRQAKPGPTVDGDTSRADDRTVQRRRSGLSNATCGLGYPGSTRASSRGARMLAVEGRNCCKGARCGQL